MARRRAFLSSACKSEVQDDLHPDFSSLNVWHIPLCPPVSKLPEDGQPSYNWQLTERVIRNLLQLPPHPLPQITQERLQTSLLDGWLKVHEISKMCSVPKSSDTAKKCCFAVREERRRCRKGHTTTAMQWHVCVQSFWQVVDGQQVFLCTFFFLVVLNPARYKNRAGLCTNKEWHRLSCYFPRFLTRAYKKGNPSCSQFGFPKGNG